jgi:hypothetical protein
VKAPRLAALALVLGAAAVVALALALRPGPGSYRVVIVDGRQSPCADRLAAALPAVLARAGLERATVSVAGSAVMVKLERRDDGGLASIVTAACEGPGWDVAEVTEFSLQSGDGWIRLPPPPVGGGGLGGGPAEPSRQ